MENALYYGFSTIAQTLAAAIALLGALVLFRLQALSTAMRAPAKYLTENFHLDSDGGMELTGLLLAENYSGIQKALQEGRFKRPVDSNQQASSARTTLSELLATREAVLSDLRNGLWWTSALIAASVGVLFMTPILVTVTWAGVTAGILGIGALLVCLGLYARIVRRVVGATGAV